MKLNLLFKEVDLIANFSSWQIFLFYNFLKQILFLNSFEEELTILHLYDKKLLLLFLFNNYLLIFEFRSKV